MKRYIYRGKILFIASGQRDGEKFFTTFFKDSKGFKRPLFFNEELVRRETAEEAQRDLDEFARVRKLKEAE